MFSLSLAAFLPTHVTCAVHMNIIALLVKLMQEEKKPETSPRPTAASACFCHPLQRCVGRCSS